MASKRGKHPLRPRLYAQELDKTISAAAESRAVLDVASEAQRIARLSGFSIVIVATDLVEAGLAARINMELPALQEMRRSQAAHHHLGTRRIQ
jgi:uncharacterized metal-binding protein